LNKLSFVPDKKKYALKRTLRRFLEKHGMTQKELCKACDIPESTFTGWTASVKPQDISRVSDVAKFAREKCNDEKYGDFIYLLFGDKEDQEFLNSEIKNNVKEELPTLFDFEEVS